MHDSIMHETHRRAYSSDADGEEKVYLIHGLAFGLRWTARLEVAAYPEITTKLLGENHDFRVDNTPRDGPELRFDISGEAKCW